MSSASLWCLLHQVHRNLHTPLHLLPRHSQVMNTCSLRHPLWMPDLHCECSIFSLVQLVDDICLFYFTLASDTCPFLHEACCETHSHLSSRVLHPHMNGFHFRYQKLSLDFRSIDEVARANFWDWFLPVLTVSAHFSMHTSYSAPQLAQIELSAPSHPLIHGSQCSSSPLQFPPVAMQFLYLQRIHFTDLALKILIVSDRSLRILPHYPISIL